MQHVQRRKDTIANVLFASGYLAILMIVLIPRSFWS